MISMAFYVILYGSQTSHEDEATEWHLAES